MTIENRDESRRGDDTFDLVPSSHTNVTGLHPIESCLNDFHLSLIAHFFSLIASRPASPFF